MRFAAAGQMPALAEFTVVHPAFFVLAALARIVAGLAVQFL